MLQKCSGVTSRDAKAPMAHISKVLSVENRFQLICHVRSGPTHAIPPRWKEVTHAIRIRVEEKKSFKDSQT